QNRQPAAGEHYYVAPGPLVHALVQFSPLGEHRTRDSGFMAHQIHELARRRMRGQVRRRDSESFHVAARKIDSSLVEIDCNILPEVGELQSAADQVRQMLPPGVAVAE